MELFQIKLKSEVAKQLQNFTSTGREKFCRFLAIKSKHHSVVVRKDFASILFLKTQNARNAVFRTAACSANSV